MTSTPPTRGGLSFRKPAGPPLGLILSCVLVAGMAAWMSLGSPKSDVATHKKSGTDPQPLVRAHISSARPYTRKITLYGVTRPERAAMLVSRIEGYIDDLPVQKGDPVKTGTAVARIRVEDLPARIAEADAGVEKARRDLTNALELRDREIASEDRVVTARTALKQAQAARARVYRDKTDSIIRSPFPGYLETLDAEEGTAITAGQVIGHIVDTSSLLVSVQISQSGIRDIHTGSQAIVRLPGGDETEGEITYIAREANEATRTFDVDIRIPNTDGALRSGMSTTVVLDGPKLMAHALSPAWLSLLDTGSLAVKTVSSDDIVQTNPVKIIGSNHEQIWVSGLPNTARIITAGQGMVSAGDRVTTDERPLS